ncbi:hypothetical protein Pan44_14140 [Caulifigura coniformis]|uniref:Uncharacterized protein n=1 Tax=Caulifigura coniformis TaxID=2527983 RepID=A0A517SB81_9PLAN|nr:hypothetical protein [Caulifigura coniformis]QDT53397.1 hypothetical protein Pan44_14140 [Caulifigura coniformis]
MSNAFRQMLCSLKKTGPRGRTRSDWRGAETLETRILPIATVNFTGSALTITGDSSDNNISISHVAGQLIVDANGGLITVAGSDVPSFQFNLNGAFSLTATFGGGSDVLQVAGLPLKSVRISMGDGLSNQVTLEGVAISGKLAIDAGNGADSVTLLETSVAGTTLIDTGTNNDTIEIGDGAYIGATTITTGLGTDTVQIGSLEKARFAGKLTITTGGDADVVELSGLVTRGISINSGDGADTVNLENILADGAVSVKTGNDADTVGVMALIQSGSGTNVFDLGSDTDVLNVSVSSFAAAMSIDLGSGVNNTATIGDTVFNSRFTLNASGQADSIGIDPVPSGGSQTTFFGAARFNVGQATAVVIGAGDPDTIIKFLSRWSFTATGTPNSTLAVAANVSFFSPPVLKKFTLV